MKKPQVVATPGASEDNVKPGKEMNVMTKNSTAAAQIIPFDFRGESVRAITINGDPWFVASDVCRILEVANTTQALQSLDDDERSMFNIGRQGEVNIVSESGLYTLILRCRDAVKKGSKPHAFRKWVTAEVLPAIRKHGRYEDADGTITTLVGDVIGSTGEIVLDRVIEQKGAKIDPILQRSFKHTMKSRLRTRFNVQKTSLIPADQLADACNFIAAYAIDGEFLPRQEDPAKHLDIHFPVSRWLRDCSSFAKAQELQAPGRLLISPRMLYGMDFLSPTLRLLNDLARAGYNVEACKLETMAARDLVQRLSSDLCEIQRLCGVSLQQGIRFQVAKEVAA